MSSPLPVNAKQGYREGSDYLSSSVDRALSTARLGTSPKSLTSSHHTYGSTNDLEHMNTTHSGNLFRPLSTATYNPEDNTVSADLSEDQVVQVVKRHLVDTSPAASLRSASIHRSITNEDDRGSALRSVHQLPGGAITHDIYKWAEDAENEQIARRQRSQSFYLPKGEPLDPTLARLKDPGGFRRHFVVHKAARLGRAPPNWMTRTFVDFLALYGHFGGEDLSEEEEEEEADEEQGPEEEEPLIGRPPHNAVQGTATPAKAVFLLLKSFVGTGVMFLPKAFYNGGLAFSTILLTTIALISLYTFLLLVETRNKIPVSFGDIGAQNVQALIESVSQCQLQVPLSYLILAQIAVFVPLAMIRRIQKLSAFALIADLFILIGLVYLYYYDFFTLSQHGIADVEWTINYASFPMFIVIPITESMAEPEKFPKVLSGTMIFITTIFLSVGFISYLAFGSQVQTVILLNMPGTAAVNTVQGLYALAICLSIPLQLFPAIRIIETGLFTRSGKYDNLVKWQKNMFRFVAVLVCAAIAIAGSSDLDKFVSLIGSLCCVPLCFFFPPLFHLKAIANNWRQKTADMLIIVFGLVSMIYTTFITVSLWSEGGESAPISRCS
ncbi:hypothetical protein BCV72DRAFT_251751 [Rhizopus microsporus var. microsporus]|uniref:Amino acid transporter transmembrane domain-containing protein n=1 Tax=Rhizopus microsporus var. microsporus TaxID=86635 RepID=A0A1X0QV59_RHIZD|nr:hypothetical protein BCV72DRAFT_251751 [Rhizopus microsporus var. microsporus]